MSLDKLKSYLLQQVSKISNFITLTQEMSKQQHTNSSDLGCSKNMQLASAKNSEKSWYRLERDVKDLLLSCIGKCPINTCCSLFCVSAVFVCLKEERKKSFFTKFFTKVFFRKPEFSRGSTPKVLSIQGSSICSMCGHNY